jgi:large subunit ribosomal protein L20
MVRVKNGAVSRKRHKKIIGLAKGFKGKHSHLFRVANQQVMKSLVYMYMGRKRRRRDFKKLWICRVNSAARIEGTTYNDLLYSFRLLGIPLKLKMLVYLIIFDREAFSFICFVAHIFLDPLDENVCFPIPSVTTGFINLY